jgi:peptide chain release factor
MIVRVLIRITGPDATAFAAGWTGTLCRQAPSPYRPGRGRKNWFVIASPPAGRGRWCGIRRIGRRDDSGTHRRTGWPASQQSEHAVRAIHRPTGESVVVDTGAVCP